MKEPVMADTLPLTTECSHWIVTMSMMSLPACIAQTDMDLQCFAKLTKGQMYIGLLIVCMSCIVILCPGLEA